METQLRLVAVHGHALRVSAEFPVGGRRNGPAAVALSTALLECQQLLGTECLVVDLRRGLDEILQVSSQEEVSEVDEFAVVLVLDVDDTPAVLAAAHLLAIDNNRLLGADNCERHKALDSWLAF